MRQLVVIVDGIHVHVPLDTTIARSWHTVKSRSRSAHSSVTPITSGNISCGLLLRSDLSDEWIFNASGSVEADSNSAIVFRYFNTKNAGDHCCNYRKMKRKGGGGSGVEGREEAMLRQ